MQNLGILLVIVNKRDLQPVILLNGFLVLFEINEELSPFLIAFFDWINDEHHSSGNLSCKTTELMNGTTNEKTYLIEIICIPLNNQDNSLLELVVIYHPNFSQFPSSFWVALTCHLVLCFVLLEVLFNPTSFVHYFVVVVIK